MKAIFLDRDGVINKYPGDKGYVTSLRLFRFLPRAKRAIALLTKNHYKLFVISNQAGVGRRIYSRRTLDNITKKMLQELKKAGGNIERVYYCTHRKEANCSCRKPKAGLLRAAAARYPIVLKKSYFIGDSIRDVLTAHAAGCKSVLVLSGREKLSNRNNWERQPDIIRKDLFEAVSYIIGKK